VWQPGRPRREGQVLERRPAAVEALEGDPSPAAAPADDLVDDGLPLDRPLADDRPQQLLELAAEERTGGRVRRDVVPLVVPDEEADVGCLNRLGEQRRLDVRRGQELGGLALQRGCGTIRMYGRGDFQPCG
jgi:hypothetical protein